MKTDENDNWLQEFNDYYDTHFAVDDDYYFAFDYETEYEDCPDL